MSNTSGARLSTAVSASRLRVPRSVLQKTVLGLRDRSNGRVESACMWIGDRTGQVRRVIFHHEIADDRATALSLELPEKAKFALYKSLASTHENILALLHTHPHDWVDLSPIDQANQISSRVGFWSIVLPQYAQTFWDLNTVRFHIRCERGWRRLSPIEVAAALTVSDHE